MFLLKVAAIALFIGGFIGWVLAFAGIIRSYHHSDLVVAFQRYVKGDALAIYDDGDHNEPVFQMVNDQYAAVLQRDRNPATGERHWDYWSWFKDTREDWDQTIKRVLDTGQTIVRTGEVIIYPDGNEVTIDWECGPRVDNGRPWRRPKVCGFYIAHRRSNAKADVDVLDKIAAMARKNEELRRHIDRLKDENENRVVKRAASRFMTRYGLTDDESDV